MSEKCTFSTYGYACGKPVEHGRYLCDEHAASKCRSCGQPATHGCDFCGQFVCGMPLCDECTYGTDNSKPAGNWGFINHMHVCKPEFAEKHENRRLRDVNSILLEALHEARTQISLLQSMRGIVDTGCGTLSIIDAAIAKAVPGYVPEEATS